MEEVPRSFDETETVVLHTKMKNGTEAFTQHQSAFFAHRITLEGLGDDAFAKSLSTARVDMNPHQVDAALFALGSPLSRGVLLADEVGLGKTIEASFVIAQRWAERRRRIVLIVPASLRKQWSQELFDKFSLPSVLIESKSYNQAKKVGSRGPLSDRIASSSPPTNLRRPRRRISPVAGGTWWCTTRRIDCGMSISRERSARETIARSDPLFLQNSSDRHAAAEFAHGAVWPGLRHRRTLLRGRGGIPIDLRRRGRGEQRFLFLRRRLESICKRTLRRQVQQAGLIRYTARCPLTLSFEPSDDEVAVYTAVSSYLQRPGTIAFGDRPNALVTLVVRKILGSSTFALSETLAKIIERLTAKVRPSIESLVITT